MRSAASKAPASTPASSRACDSCREAKIRCRASPQPGICQKCLDSKKECIVRTGPRTRRPKRPVVESSASPSISASSSRGNGPSTTFTIDFAVSARSEPADDIDILTSIHEGHIESILPPVGGDFDFANGAELFSKPPSPSLTPCSSTKEYPITELDRQPQFNLSSASSLLEHFHSMVVHLPFIIIPKGVTVQHLAATKPFLLLAILTSASASKSLQGQALYDAEFRKVLGIKYVGEGERTIELLQGLLVYCLWYPFHIRPRSKQIFQYIRMVGDLVHDMGLDEDNAEPGQFQGEIERLDGLRAYLAFTYLDSAVKSSWRPQIRASSSNATWTLQCCDILERDSTSVTDMSLATLARLEYLHTEAVAVTFNRGKQPEDQRRIVLLGLQSRLLELQHQVPPEVASSPSVKLTSLFLSFCLDSTSLFHRSGPRKTSADKDMLRPQAMVLARAVQPTAQFLNYILSLDSKHFSCLTAIDWCRIIIAIIVAIRLSLPVAECPDFDSPWARSEIRLHDFLGKMGPQDTMLPASNIQKDTLSLILVVLRIVQRKFDQRVQAAERLESAALYQLTPIGCPFLDGSMDQYMSQWDPEVVTMPDPGSAAMATSGQQYPGRQTHRSGPGAPQPVFHDIWATMTMGWASGDQ